MLKTKKRRVALNVFLALFLLAAAIVGVAVGATDIPINSALDGIRATIFGSLSGENRGDPGSEIDVDLQIISEVRFPRIMLGIIVGAGLGVCGLVTQSLLRNPLGDPYILGISSGASTGAAAVIVLGANSSLLSSFGITFGAFLGAIAAVVSVTVLASVGGRITPTRLIFAGMAVNYLFGALTSLITLMAKNAAGAKSVLFWTLGSLSTASWQDVGLAMVVTTFSISAFFVLGRRIDVLNLGDTTAISLGTNPRIYRSVLFLFVAFSVAVLVSLTGAIGFVGLVVPHIAKQLVGATTRLALPISALLGALLVVIADTFTRVAIRPAELPIGILTAIVGTPMLMTLIRRYAK